MTVELASQKASEWCERHPKWKRICDIANSDLMMLTWDEIPMRYRRYWICLFGMSAENAWRESSDDQFTRHRFGFIGSDGEFYDSIIKLPRNMNSMMVFEVGGKPGAYRNGGMKERSVKI